MTPATAAVDDDMMLKCEYMRAGIRAMRFCVWSVLKSSPKNKNKSVFSGEMYALQD